MRAANFLRLRHAYALLFLIIFFKISADAQTLSMKLGYRRAINSDWFALNGPNPGVYIGDQNLLSHVPNLHPKLIRWPAGGAANWWDWKKGWFVNDPEVDSLYPNVTPEDNTLENLKLLLNATGAKPLFVLNMLSSNLQYQLEMLKHADSIGIAVQYVELGNEYYLADEGDSSIKYQKFPTAEAYGLISTRWIDSIHHYFPNAKVAAQGAFNRSGPERRLVWDTSLVKTLQREDAISFHHYFNASSTEAAGLGDLHFTQADVKEFMSRPFKAWNILSTQDLPTVRPGREVWITEYNLQDRTIPVHGSWAHGLFVTTQSLLYLQSELIKSVYFYHMDGSAYGAYFNDINGLTYGPGSIFIAAPNPPPTTPWDLSAAGQGIKIVSDAIQGMTYASPLNLINIPNLTSVSNGDTVVYPAVYGWEFSNASSSAAVIVNLSGNTYTFSTSGAFPGGGTFTKYSADPTSYIADDDEISTQNGTLSGTIVLSPYSITKINSNAVPPAPPSLTITTTSPTSLCAGDSAQLDAGVGFISYQWSNGATTRKIWVKNTGDYWVYAYKNTNGYYATDTMHITVNKLPDNPVIYNSGKDAFCLGLNTTLKLINPFAVNTYLWSNGVTDTDLLVSNAGTYSVKTTDANGCTAVSNSLSVSTYPLPQPVITFSGSADFCDGKYVTLGTTKSYNGYEWSNNKHGQTLKATATGSYYVTVTDANTCTATSSSVSITAHTPPVPPVNIIGPPSFCDGTSPTHLSTVSGYNYQWKKGTKQLNGATDRTYYPSDDGSYTVSITDIYGCSKKSTASAAISVIAPPDAHISFTGSKNVCNGATCLLTANVGVGQTYQWTKNGVNIPLAILFTYAAGSAGDYQCKVTNLSGCMEISNTVTITSNCKEDAPVESEQHQPEWLVYPNPASNQLHITLSLGEELTNNNCLLEIRNLIGQVIWKEEKIIRGSQLTSDILLGAQLSDGVYVLVAGYGDHTFHTQFIVSRR